MSQGCHVIVLHFTKNVLDKNFIFLESLLSHNISGPYMKLK
jgi:hypothetical protein